MKFTLLEAYKAINDRDALIRELVAALQKVREADLDTYETLLDPVTRDVVCTTLEKVRAPQWAQPGYQEAVDAVRAFLACNAIPPTNDMREAHRLALAAVAIIDGNKRLEVVTREEKP